MYKVAPGFRPCPRERETSACIRWHQAFALRVTSACIRTRGPRRKPGASSYTRKRFSLSQAPARLSPWHQGPGFCPRPADTNQICLSKASTSKFKCKALLAGSITVEFEIEADSEAAAKSAGAAVETADLTAGALLRTSARPTLNLLLLLLLHLLLFLRTSV